MKKVILTESQFNKLMEQELFFDLEQLPTMIETISKDINEGKKSMSKLLAFLKTVTIGHILEEPTMYTKVIEDCGKLAKIYNAKFNKYYDIRDSFENQEDTEDNPHSDEFYQFEKLVNEIDNLQLDLDNLCDMFSEIVEQFLDSGKPSERIKYYEKQYPPETINITPIDNNPE